MLLFVIHSDMFIQSTFLIKSLSQVLAEDELCCSFGKLSAGKLS